MGEKIRIPASLVLFPSFSLISEIGREGKKLLVRSSPPSPLWRQSHSPGK